MTKDEVCIIQRGIYDIENCVGVEELKRTIHIINSSGWSIVSMTQFEEVYTVLFRRPAHA